MFVLLRVCQAAKSPKLKPILRRNNKSALHSAKTAQNRSKGYLSQTELRTDVQMANMSTRRRATEKRSEVEQSGVEDISFIPEFNLSVLEMPAQMLEGPPSSVFWGAGSDFYHV